MCVDKNEMLEKKYIKLSNIFYDLSLKEREKIWKEFFEKANKNMNILEFIELKIKKGELKIPKTLNTT